LPGLYTLYVLSFPQTFFREGISGIGSTLLFINMPKIRPRPS